MTRPILPVDCPDTDMIRVGEKYYMLSTSMYFMPGCEILESDDLVEWRHATYVFDSLDGTRTQRLEEGNIYGAGMWAASLRHHNGLFYICFVANDTQKTYLFTSKNIKGPWKKSYIDGFYHDNSILFDDDGKIYIAYGNRQIYITELKEDLSGPQPGGFHKMVVRDSDECQLGYEGTHFYKIDGTYYLFFIHSIPGRWFRTQVCFRADSLEDEFVGREVFADDNGYRNAGIAQGGIVDTQDGRWFATLFQDRGGSGRIPYLIPVRFEDKWPVFGDNGKLPGDCAYAKTTGNCSLVGGDDFTKVYEEDSCFGFKHIWQFNHEPDMNLISRDTSLGRYCVTTDKLCTEVTEAKNTLTQRMSEPGSEAFVTIDASRLNAGDYIGLAALQFLYGFVGLRKDEDGYSVVYSYKEKPESEEKTVVLEKTDRAVIRVRIRAEFGDDSDEAYFYYDCGKGMTRAPFVRNMPFMLEHFTGYRFALAVYSTKETGGTGSFSCFEMEGVEDFLHMSLLVEKAYEVASRMHAGMLDKGGHPYIEHPIAVARQVAVYGEEYAAVALLHDVMEDCDISADELGDIFPQKIVDTLELLTHRKSGKDDADWLEDYFDYVRRIRESGSDIAVKVKIADLHNNMDISRINNPTEKDYKRITEKYVPALNLLT